MAVKPVVHDDATNKHRPLGSGEKMDGLSASSIISSQSGNLITTGSDGLAYATGSGIADPAADNLIEATSGGKLKVDMDRVVDWLDGHSSDASALASAINVVSDDSGNVIVEGTDSGAYLSKAALSNAIGSMTDAQLQSLAAAIADGQTIVASGGKLIVDPTNATDAKLKKITAVLPKNQGGIVADSSTGKLYVDFDAMTPEFKRNLVLSMVDLDGGLAVHDSGAKKGTIYVDFSRIDDTTKRDIVMSMVDLEGGLAVHPADAGADKAGRLYVDFSTMPQDVREDLLKDLRMQVPLNGTTFARVDPTSSSATDSPDVKRVREVRSLSDNTYNLKPYFVTIQAAIDYITSNYALGEYNFYISIVGFDSGTEQPIVYDEILSLPTYTRTSGRMILRAFELSHPPLVQPYRPSGGFSETVAKCTGTWSLYGINFHGSFSSPADGVNHFPSVFSCQSGGDASLYGCAFSAEYTGAAHGGGSLTFSPFVLSAYSGSSITLGVLPGYHNSFSCIQGNASTASVFYLERNSQLAIPGGNTLGEGEEAPGLVTYRMPCSGTAARFASVTGNSLVLRTRGTLYAQTFLDNGMTCAEYSITSGSGVAAPAGGFPGDSTGNTLDTATNCWYTEDPA